MVLASEGQLGIGTTAVVAAASAILGAITGGIASFKANVALDNRRRRARAAIRRKAKVYTPLRAESIALSRAMDQDEHFAWGIDTKERNPEWPDKGPVWRLWPALKEDGRAATAASRKIVRALDRAEEDIAHFEGKRMQAFSVLAEVGYETYEKIVGEQMTIVNAFDSGTALLEVFRNEDGEVWYPFQRTAGEAHFGALRASLNANARVQGLRETLEASNLRLRAGIATAIDELEAGIASIARRHEMEEVED